MLPAMLRISHVLLPLALATTGCVKQAALNMMADELSSGGGGAFTQDEDLQFLGESLPFALKTMESLHASNPEHTGLLESLASGFTQYAAVYVQFPAEQKEDEDYEAYLEGIARARGFYDRALRYGMEGLQRVHPDLVSLDPAAQEQALSAAGPDEVGLLFWTGASWLAGISLSKEDPERIGQLPLAAALVHRALALDEDWDRGAIHELLISLEPALPLPGGAERARTHYERALELSGGVRAGVYVSLATAVSVPNQDREEFLSLLDRALAIDPAEHPQDQLSNLYAQQKARFLLARIDDLIL